MVKRTCYLFVFDGFADWEPAHITTTLSKYSDFEIKTFSVDGKAVRSMGNLNVQPDMGLSEAEGYKFDLLLLPGGTVWEENGNTEITSLILRCFDDKTTIAAICGATLSLARAGIFDKVKHTSNGLEYLKSQCPAYTNEQAYLNQPAVSDQNVITANGAAMLEFSHAVFEHFKAFPEKDLAFWFRLYKSAGMEY
ncbi:MAG TPA: type 1 glutamine amidotransferase family protein [Mucilaginibacter sp.]|jgi:transcriptional regulator GlxA family with amidase domain|nr:type 1 glutamine amidotransferase family protein [Mucilaginibacter sp.]